MLSQRRGPQIIRRGRRAGRAALISHDHKSAVIPAAHLDPEPPAGTIGPGVNDGVRRQLGDNLPDRIGVRVAGQLLVTAGQNADRLRSQAAFAMLCGAAPLPASSGRTDRHRLNRGGDRQANLALYRIVLCRMRWEPRTRAYVERRTKDGLSKKEIIRCLKRYVAREIYRILVPDTQTNDLETIT